MNLPDNVTDKMIDEHFGSEVFGPLFVEVKVSGFWDLWAECSDLTTVREEVAILKDHGFEYRVTDASDVRRIA